jgi:hypothetical protein
MQLHPFGPTDVYLGLSIQVSSPATNAEIKSQIKSIPGLVSVSSVYDVTIGALPNSTAGIPFNPSLIDLHWPLSARRFNGRRR